MSARPLDTSAAAFHLLALLEQYEQDTSVLLASSGAADLYARWCGLFEEMRPAALTVPDLHLPWLHLLIHRSELAQAVREVAQSTGSCSTLAVVERRHGQAIAVLRTQSLAFIRPEHSHAMS